jgi:predicted Zn-dependent protease
MHTGVCQWNFRASANRSMNASAGKNGLIVVNRGIVEYAENEEEVAMVIAHEIGHQAANHPSNIVTRPSGVWPELYSLVFLAGWLPAAAATAAQSPVLLRTREPTSVAP